LDKHSDKVKEIMQRKDDHIAICLDKPVSSRYKSALFEDIELINNSLPEIDFDEVDVRTSFLKHKLSAPLLVGAMTGGSENAKRINKNVAIAVQKLGLGMTVGSQRAGLYDPKLKDTYSITRKSAPDAFIGANIGGAQLSKGFDFKDAEKLVEMLDADALYVHLNPAQEVIQPEGDPNYKNVLGKIGELVDKLDIPVIVKEVGFGISADAAKRLQSVGVSAIEIAGMGGTSYTAIESYRAKDMNMQTKYIAGLNLWDWGIPTLASLCMVRKAVKIPVIASGGIRNGIDVAKCLVLGANICATALPILKAANISAEKTIEAINQFVYELKCAMFLTGSKDISRIKDAEYIIKGELKEWLV
jgi:isopentenyl-diphosphate Delta-isomerase